jgi:hypothetical protein
MQSELQYLTWLMHKEVANDAYERWLHGAFYDRNGYFPDLKNPVTFNEKMCWLRLHYCTDEVLKVIEKATFKKYIEDKLGPGYTAVCYGIFEDELEVNFDRLPNTFVLKSTLSSASQHIRIVRDKLSINQEFLRYELSQWLQLWNSSASSFSKCNHSLFPRILAEELLDPADGELLDYKVMCFHGEPFCVFVVSDRFGGKYVDFFDLEWNHMPIKRKFENAPKHPEKPSGFQKMLELSRVLAKEFPFVRVDFYQVDSRIILGELTFSPGGGVEPFTPKYWDYTFGELLTLPEISKP